MYCFTLNGFPYGVFHGQRVKNKVYLPHWADRKRLDHTVRLAKILSVLLPEGESGSISTVPVGYKTHLGEKDMEQSLEFLARAVLELALLEQQTGKRISLALEPEPDCLLENALSAISFFKDVLWIKGGVIAQ